MNLRPLPMLVRAVGLACSMLVVDPLPAQVVFSPSEVQITSTAGQVNVTSASGTKITDLQVPTASGEKPTTATHRPGAVIETGPDSQATVSIPGAGSMLLGSETQVRLPKTGDKAQSLELLKGKLFLNISAEEVKKQGEASFRLKTPAALLAVKGTKFFASVEKDQETAGVHEGQIGTFAMASRQLNDVQSGNALSIVKGKPEPIRPLTADERRESIHYELAASEGRITNSLGMKFAAVPGTKVLFCIHETRFKDYAAYHAEVKHRFMDAWQQQTYAGFKITEKNQEHPVVSIGAAYALGFCDWLGKKEGRKYRLPTDEEWSFAVGIGRKEEALPVGTNLDGAVTDHFPWGETWPPRSKIGNYCDETYHKKLRPQDPYLIGYDDGFPTTSPVMSFSPNTFGLFDLGGNVSEWVFQSKTAPNISIDRSLERLPVPPLQTRGGSFLHSSRDMLLSSRRIINTGGWGGEPDQTFRITMMIE
jgi:formylglycine-generating enzyme required for sulfatase activity